MIRQAGHRLFFRVVGIFSDPLVILTKAHVRNLQVRDLNVSFRIHNCNSPYFYINPG